VDAPAIDRFLCVETGAQGVAASGHSTYASLIRGCRTAAASAGSAGAGGEHRRRSGVAPLFAADVLADYYELLRSRRAALRDLFQKADRKEVPQAIDAGIIGGCQNCSWKRQSCRDGRDKKASNPPSSQGSSMYAATGRASGVTKGSSLRRRPAYEHLSAIRASKTRRSLTA